MLTEILPGLFRHSNTCQAYAIHTGQGYVVIDFGDGDLLEQFPQPDSQPILAVLMTHHHRDGAQGLNLAAARGIPIWVPQAEKEFFEGAEDFWQSRPVLNSYNPRQDRFSPLSNLPIAGVLVDYDRLTFGIQPNTVQVQVLPSPGHTPGSISLLVEMAGKRVVFTGDLIAGPGQVWSLSGMQWTYNGLEGVAASLASLLNLKNQHPDLLLPSHGEPMWEPQTSIDCLVERLWALLQVRGENRRLFDWIEHPYQAITPHLLWNQTSLANSYVLLSESGKALLIDFGYDFMTGLAGGEDRAARRPWLYSLPALKRDFAVSSIEAAIPTHYHDDHVAGLNLLRQFEGTQIWAAENFASILENPGAYNLPCLWFDPIRIDRCLALETPFHWHEYEITLHALPGHTRYAAAISFVVDGLRTLAIGDQYMYKDGWKLNYTYANGYQMGDYLRSAALLQSIHPDLILTGHWGAVFPTASFFEEISTQAQVTETLQAHLLPPERQILEAGPAQAHLFPYEASIPSMGVLALNAQVINPMRYPTEITARLEAPPGWDIQPAQHTCFLGSHESASLPFTIQPPRGTYARRVRLALDLIAGNQHLGQVAEALITVQ